MSRRQYVWVVTDDKYGPQAVYTTKRIADAACKKHDWLHVSGGGSTPIKFELRSEP